MAEYLSDLVDNLSWKGIKPGDEESPDPELMIKVNGLVVSVEEIEIRWNEIIFKARSE